MKVIHTYIDKQNLIWKELLYTQYLSAILAKKHYGSISFYGDEISCKQIKDLGIPYDEINQDVLVKGDTDTWSIPKIKVYESIKEPFLHIDTDTLLFNKILLDRYDSDYVFSHRDMFIDGKGETLKNLFIYWFCNLDEKEMDQNKYPFRSLVKDSNNKIPKIILEKMSKDMDYPHVDRTYSKLFFDLMENMSDKVFDEVHFESIPNMNITYVRNHETFGKVCRETLNHYYSNKKRIDDEVYGSCYIEQLMLHTNLRLHDKKYKKSSKKGNNFIFHDIPTATVDAHNNVPDISSVKFPFKLKVNNNDHFKSECCDHGVISPLSKTQKKPDDFYELIITDIDDIKNYFDHEFNGFFHTTYMKWYDIIQVIIIDKLRKEIGDDEIRRIHNYFRNHYPSRGLPTTSNGERLYTRLTGFKFHGTTSLI